MSKLAYFLGGMIAGAAALGVVSWFVAGRDGDSCCSLGDDDDGYLRDDAAPEAGGATVHEAGSAASAEAAGATVHEADSATSTEAGDATVHEADSAASAEAGGAGMPEAAPAAEAAARQAEPAGSEAPQPA